jgi:hypothetical protein
MRPQHDSDKNRLARAQSAQQEKPAQAAADSSAQGVGRVELAHIAAHPARTLRDRPRHGWQCAAHEQGGRRQN